MEKYKRDTIKLGNKDCEVVLLLETCKKIKKKFNKIYTNQKYNRKINKELVNVEKEYQKLKDDLKKFLDENVITKEEYTTKYKELIVSESSLINNIKLNIPDSFFIWAAWEILDKRGIWPFRKPFRSMGQLSKKIEIGEAEEAIIYIGSKILNLPVKSREDTQNSQITQTKKNVEEK